MTAWATVPELVVNCAHLVGLRQPTTPSRCSTQWRDRVRTHCSGVSLFGHITSDRQALRLGQRTRKSLKSQGYGKIRRVPHTIPRWNHPRPSLYPIPTKRVPVNTPMEPTKWSYIPPASSLPLLSSHYASLYF